MKVREVMTRNVKTISPNSSIREVATQMKNLNIGSIPVCDTTNRIVGIVTDRDIVVRGISDGSDANIPIREVMSSNIISVTPDTDIHEATNIMSQNQIRRLPVVENNKIVGILAIGDLAVRDYYIDEAGEALSNISEPSRPMM